MAMPQQPDPRFVLVAGEASGDLLAGLLLSGMKARWPKLTSQGIGGPRMAEQGFEAWWPHDKLAVRGYVEVLRHYREIVGIRRQLAERVLAHPPDLFIGVDAPDFNLPLEATLKAKGVPCAHFVSPSVWAWRSERVKTISRSVDHLLCVFPFEPALYAAHGVPATYVGHPLADVIPLEVPRASARAALGLEADETVVALLPGSRRSELHYIAPRLLGAAAILAAKRPALKFVLPAVPGFKPMLQALCQRYAPGVAIQLLDGQSHAALAACDAVIVASGTATLEAALFKRPMVIAYAMHPVSWQMMKRMRYQPWVGLPNILLSDFAVPELLQGDATPQRLADATLQWLDDPAAAKRLHARFDALHLQLRRNTAQAATDAIQAILGR